MQQPLVISLLIIEFQFLLSVILFWLYIQKRKRKVLIRSNTIEMNGVSFDEKEYEFIADEPVCDAPQSRWVIVQESAIGKQHLNGKDPQPCQDSCKVNEISDQCGIAVVCDGAGSAGNSDKGSQYVSELAINAFGKIVLEKGWSQGVFPEEQEWSSIAEETLTMIYEQLKSYARENAYNINSLACTIIVLIYLPDGLLLTHIGDGRAAYQNTEGEWNAILQPHKGDEANQTIFITTEVWMKGNTKLKNIVVPESIIVKDNVEAFALMSDGCERHCFELGYFDQENQRFIAQNNPYSGFFNPIKSKLTQMYISGMSPSQMSLKWKDFLEKGTPGLRDESDDKTMILGIKTG